MHGLTETRVNSIIAANDEASNESPSVLIAGHLVHVFRRGRDWEVWLNTEDMNFTGLCICVGTTRSQAVTPAVAALTAVCEYLDGRPAAPQEPS